jgi:hypothetical protein
MASNAIVFGWNRSIPGREGISAEHFAQFVGYLTNLKGNGTISNFETVFMNPAAGNAVMNGFFLIQGDTQKLHAMSETQDWVEHMTRASLHLEGAGAVFASTGTEVMSRMQVWTKSIPTK